MSDRSLILFVQPVTVDVHVSLGFDEVNDRTIPNWQPYETIQRTYPPGTVLKAQLIDEDNDETVVQVGDAVMTLPDSVWVRWKRVFKAKEAAKLLRYKPSTIYKLYENGKLTGYDEGGIRIHGDSLASLMWAKPVTMAKADTEQSVPSDNPTPSAPSEERQRRGRPAKKPSTRLFPGLVPPAPRQTR